LKRTPSELAAARSSARFAQLNEHQIGLVRKHAADFERFGKVGFEIRLNRRGSSTEFAMLNEHQAF
jgi:hypothetical protein